MSAVPEEGATVWWVGEYGGGCDMVSWWRGEFCLYEVYDSMRNLYMKDIKDL
jgi:hypothetical protein